MWQWQSERSEQEAADPTLEVTLKASLLRKIGLVPTHPLPLTQLRFRELGGFDNLFHTFWTRRIDTFMSQGSSVTCSQEYAAWHGGSTGTHLDKNDLGTCQGCPVSTVQGHLDERERARAEHSQIWRPQHQGHSFPCFHFISSYKTRRAGVWVLLTGWQVRLVPPWGLLGGSPAQRALAASAFCHYFEFMGKGKMPKVLAGEFFVPFQRIWLMLTDDL